MGLKINQLGSTLKWTFLHFLPSAPPKPKFQGKETIITTQLKKQSGWVWVCYILNQSNAFFICEIVKLKLIPEE